jgi:CBS domain-containing protein
MASQGTQQVRDVMTSAVETIAPDATVQEAARKMTDTQHGPLPVVEGDQVVGIITDRDIVTRAVAAGRTDMTVRDAMTTEVVTIFEDQDAAEAAATLQAKQVSRAIVLNRNTNQIAGIVALADLPLKRLGT